MKSKIILIPTILMMLILLVAGCVNNNENSNNNSITDTWLDDYKPVHSIGTGENDFWINYPTGNPLSGQEVDHFSWIEDSLKDQPVLFVVHKTGCVGCADQAERVIQLGEKYTEDVKFYDLDAVDGAPADIHQKANEVYMYDPNGSPGYIALTGVYTLIEDNGEIKIGWHTWEAPNDLTVSNSDLETWIKDAIYYFNVNSGR